MSLIEALQREISRPTLDTETLSPRGDRPVEVFAGAKGRTPLVWVSVAAVAFALLVFGTLKLTLRATVASIADAPAVRQVP